MVTGPHTSPGQEPRSKNRPQFKAAAREAYWGNDERCADNMCASSNPVDNSNAYVVQDKHEELVGPKIS